MSFTKYPEYIESGIDWLGPVPITWLIQRSDAVLKSTRRQIDPSQFAKEEVFHYSIPSVQEIGTGRIEDGSEIASAKQLIDKKVVLVSKLNPRKATTCIAEPKGRLTLCSTEFVSLEPKNLSIEYLAYLVQGEGFRQSLESKVMSVTNSHQRAEPSDICRFWMALPSQLEQQKISTFLDRETAKIDALVAEQERLIELLEEKRQAVISHAVTKGLDPTTPTIDLGIPWMGSVPIHWRATRIKHLARPGVGGFVDGDWIESPFITTEGVRLLQCGNVGTGVFEEQGFRYVAESTFRQLKCSEVEPGDVLICRLQSSRTILAGRACIAPDLGVRMITSVDNCILKPSAEFDSAYIVYLLSTPEYLGYIEDVARGGTRDRVSRSMLGNVALAVPPLAEQRQIVDYIRSNTEVTDLLRANSAESIRLLLERRSALISAAVTGQIDVRQLEVA